MHLRGSCALVTTSFQKRYKNVNVFNILPSAKFFIVEKQRVEYVPIFWANHGKRPETRENQTYRQVIGRLIHRFGGRNNACLHGPKIAAPFRESYGLSDDG
jgi:hypothetical protein